jgi:PKD repeat protein
VVPQISAASAMPTTIWEGQQSQLSVTATDADGPQPLSYAWQIVSGGGTLSNAAVANPVYTAPADVVGTQTVTLRVTVSDGAGSATRDVAVTVQDTTPPPPGTQILGQDFSVNSFAGWSYVDEGTISAPSKWRIVSGELVQQSNIRDGSATNDLAKLGTYLLYEDGLGWTDYKARFRMRSTDDDGLGLMFRFIDNDNWYRFSWDAQLKQRRLVKKAGGVYTLLAADNVPYVLGQNYQVEVVAQGSQLEVWIDGVRVFLVSDAAHNRGSVAFYTWQNNAAYFDNLVIEDLSGGNFNALPKITATSATPATILDNQMSQLQVTATDTDGPQALGYKWTIVSGGGTLSSATVANPVYTPADVVGTQTVKLKVEVSDGAATVSGNLTLRVDDANPPPLGPLLLASEFADSAAMTGWSRIDEGTLTAPSKWGIVSGWLAQQSNIRDASTANQLPKLGTYLLYGGGTNWTNYRAKFKLRTTDDDTLGVMFRVADTNNYYRFSWNRQLNQRQLVKSVGGVFTLLAADNVPYVMGQTYQVEVIAEGSQLEVWIDGARVFQIGDASLAQGSIAFYSWQNNAAFFDDLQINAIE